MAINFIKNNVKLIEKEGQDILITENPISKAKIDILGISRQEGTPNPEENVVEIQNPGNNINLFDKTTITENKWLNSVGNLQDTSSTNNVSDYIDVKRTNNIAFQGLKKATTSSVSHCFYDKDKIFISSISSSTIQESGVLKVPENAKYIRFTVPDISLDIFKIESGSNTTSYSAYGLANIDITIVNEDETHTQTITFPLQENQKMMEGSRTENDGIHYKRKQFNLSSLTNVSDWTNKGLNENGTYTYFTRKISDYKKDKNLKGLCSHFEFFGTVGATTNMQNKGIGCAFYYLSTNPVDNNIFYINTTIATKEELVSWLGAQETAGTPVIVEYETEEETIEAYTEEQQTAYNQLQNIALKNIIHIYSRNEIKPNLKAIIQKNINYLNLSSPKKSIGFIKNRPRHA